MAIEDWASPEFGKQVTLFFKDGENFAALFANHPGYRAYYPNNNCSEPPQLDIRRDLETG